MSVKLYLNFIYSVFDKIVVVGRAKSVDALNIAFQASVRAVPLSLIRIVSSLTSDKAPVATVGTPNVSLAASAVIVCMWLLPVIATTVAVLVVSVELPTDCSVVVMLGAV